jgi:hypothetical protein
MSIADSTGELTWLDSIYSLWWSRIECCKSLSVSLNALTIQVCWVLDGPRLSTYLLHTSFRVHHTNQPTACSYIDKTTLGVNTFVGFDLSEVRESPKGPIANGPFLDGVPDVQ